MYDDVKMTAIWMWYDNLFSKFELSIKSLWYMCIYIAITVKMLYSEVKL